MIISDFSSKNLLTFPRSQNQGKFEGITNTICNFNKTQKITKRHHAVTGFSTTLQKIAKVRINPGNLALVTFSMDSSMSRLLISLGFKESPLKMSKMFKDLFGRNFRRTSTHLQVPRQKEGERRLGRRQLNLGCLVQSREVKRTANVTSGEKYLTFFLKQRLDFI